MDTPVFSPLVWLITVILWGGSQNTQLVSKVQEIPQMFRHILLLCGRLPVLAEVSGDSCYCSSTL